MLKKLRSRYKGHCGKGYASIESNFSILLRRIFLGAILILLGVLSSIIYNKVFIEGYQCYSKVSLEQRIHEDSINNLANYISRTWGTKDAKKIILTAHKYSADTFPTTHTTLIIIAIESGFNANAQGKLKDTGLMQVLYKKSSTDIDTNIRDGTWLLKDYYQKLGNKEAAIMAYNVGIGNYIKGKRNPEYLAKYKKLEPLFISYKI